MLRSNKEKKKKRNILLLQQPKKYREIRQGKKEGPHTLSLGLELMRNPEVAFAVDHRTVRESA